MTLDASPTGRRDDDERALVAAARRGDPRAFEALVAAHADAVFRVLASHLGASEAEDASQEVFVRVHQGLGGFREDSRFSTWLYRIALNVAFTRGGRRRKSPAPLDAAHDAASGEEGPARALETDERREAVRRAIASLPEDQKAVVVLRVLEGLPFEEIARILGIPRPTAESRMARAKERLKGLLAQFLRETET